LKPKNKPRDKRKKPEKKHREGYTGERAKKRKELAQAKEPVCQKLQNLKPYKYSNKDAMTLETTQNSISKQSLIESLRRRFCGEKASTTSTKDCSKSSQKDPTSTD
jgi:hypothetical protein